MLPLVPRAQPPLPVDDEGDRQAEDAAPAPGDLLVAERDPVGDAELLPELQDRLGRLVEGDPDDLEAGAAVLLRERDELRRLRPARRAPGRPEVDDDDLAAERGEVELLPVAVAEAEGGGGSADPRHGRVGRRRRRGEERREERRPESEANARLPFSHGRRLPTRRGVPSRPSRARSSSGCRAAGRR